VTGGGRGARFGGAPSQWNLDAEIAAPFNDLCTQSGHSAVGWIGDRTAWGRFVLMCAVNILAGTGMRPKTLTEIRRWQVTSVGRDEKWASPLPPLSEFDRAATRALAGVSNPTKPLADTGNGFEAPPKYLMRGKTARACRQLGSAAPYRDA
jgi:hypothetical protein